MNDEKVIYSEKGNPLLVINCAIFFKASVIKDGKTCYVKAVSYYVYIQGVPELADQIETAYSLMVMKVKNV
jgi:hypothetical protein